MHNHNHNGKKTGRMLTSSYFGVKLVHTGIAKISLHAVARETPDLGGGIAEAAN